MDHVNARILKRLADIEKRLARLEQVGGLDDLTIHQPATDQVDTPPLPPAEIPLHTERPAFSSPRTNESLELPAYADPPRAATAKTDSTKPHATMEQLIGGRWFLVLGALIVVAGVGFFLKLAYDQGWIGAIPPAVRCLFAACFGVALIGTGLLVERRFGRFASIGIIAAGQGVLFTTAYAAYGFFTLVGSGTTFILLVSVVVLGISLALRAGSLTLAILSIACGYITPILLSKSSSPDWALPPYLLSLLLVGSVLAVRDRRYHALAPIVWWATGIFGFLWIAAVGAPAVGAAFVVLTWGIVHATRLALPRRNERNMRLRAGVVSFSTTLWTVGSLWVLADNFGLTAMWLVPAGAAMATLLGGLALAGMLDAFTQKPETTAESVGASLLCQAGALLPVAILVGIDTAWSQIAIWVLLGLGASAAGHWMRAVSLAFYGGALLVIGAARVLIEVGSPLHIGTQTVLGIVPSWWMGLMLISAAAWFVAAELTRHPVEQDSHESKHALKVLRIFQIVIACGLIALSVVHPDVTARGVLLAYIVFSVVGLGLLAARNREWLCVASVVFAFLASLVWIATFPNSGWYLSRTPLPLFTHPGLLWCLPLVGLWAAFALVVARHTKDQIRTARYVGWGAAVLLLLLATTLDVARVAGSMTNDHTLRAGSVSFWWAICAIVMLLTGFIRRIPWLRYVGIGLLLLTVAKALTYDISQVSPVVRVACFIALGLVLLGVAAQYLRSSRSGQIGGRT